MSEKKGEELMKAAEKRLNKFSFFNKSDKFEEAAELFKKAANQYKVAQFWEEAGKAFGRAADCYIQLEQNHDAATAYIDAAVCTKKSDMDKAVELYQEAIILFCDMGRFANAAKLEKEIGEMYENDNQSEKCVKHYQQAANYFMGEDSLSNANQCQLKVAHFSALMEKYDESITLYEQVAQSCLEKNALKFSAKGHLFNAGILHLCKGDVVAMQQQLEHYKEMDYTFGSSREYKLLEQLTADVEAMNVDDFTEHIFEYDSISPLDPWKTTMFLRVKKQLGGVGEDEEVNLT